MVSFCFFLSLFFNPLLGEVLWPLQMPAYWHLQKVTASSSAEAFKGSALLAAIVQGVAQGSLLLLACESCHVCAARCSQMPDSDACVCSVDSALRHWPR